MLMVGLKAVIPWGMNTHGGAFGSGVRQALMASKITGVYSTNGAYGVVATQGSVYGAVIVWGRLWPLEDAGEIPPIPGAGWIPEQRCC
jgi:hypothetical protein